MQWGESLNQQNGRPSQLASIRPAQETALRLIRRFCGPEHRNLAADLTEIYGPDPESGDFFISGMFEYNPRGEASVSETWGHVIEDNLQRMREGDRLYFESSGNGFSSSNAVINAPLKVSPAAMVSTACTRNPGTR